MAFRDFLKGTLKIALSIFLAVLALGAVGWAILAYKENSQKSEAQVYEGVKSWRADLKDNLQFDLLARTKLVDGRLQVALETDGYPAYLSHPSLRDKNKDAQLVIAFEDKDGFKVYQKVLKISEFTHKVNAKGDRIGLYHQFEDYLGVSQYKSFSIIHVGWNLETTIPVEPKVATAPTPRPKVANDSDDHCAPGISKAERLRRLAKHGTVRQTMANTYSVGYRQVTFYSESIGGEMLLCR